MQVTRQRPVIPDNTRIQRLRLTVMLGWAAPSNLDPHSSRGNQGSLNVADWLRLNLTASYGVISPLIEAKADQA